MTQALTAKWAVVVFCAAVTFVHPSRVQADEPPRVPDAVVTESTPPWSSGDYAYDGSGSIRSIGSNTYVYDTLGRLVSGTVAGGVSTQSYTYDGFGNIKTITTTGRPTRTLNVDSATNRLDGTVSGANYIATYDAAGNQISENGNGTRTFDAFNDLAVNSNGVRYIYDANDERIAITDGARTQWRWTVRDVSGRVLREFSESVNAGVSGWTWRKDYVYRESSLLGAYVNESGVAKRIHYHLDHLGTPRLTTDVTAVAKQEVEDYPFGEEYTFNVGTTETRHFTGHERDYNSGTLSENGDYLDYMHARHYAPAAGRFLSVDPTMDLKKTLPNPQMWNRYAYVTNNPLRYTDPTGRYGNDGLTKPMTPENLAMDENTPGIIKGAFYAEGGLLALAAVGEVGVTAISRVGMEAATRFPALFGAAMSWLQGETGQPSVEMANPRALERTQPLTMGRKAFANLVADIKANGIKTTVKYVVEGGKKYIVDGHHRVEAAKQLGLKLVPVEQVTLPYKGYKTAEDLAFSQH